MKDSTIALIIAGVVTILAGTPLYYVSGYVGQGIYGHGHGKNYSHRHKDSRYNHGGNGHHGGLFQVLKLKDRLGLTEDQIKLINNLKFEYD